MRGREIALGLTTALLVACSGPAATPSPTPEPTPTASPTPSPSPSPIPSPTPQPPLGRSEAAQAYLEQAVGYEVVGLPPSLETALVTQLSESLQADPTAAAAIRGYAVASVTKDGVGVAVTIVFDGDPSYTALPGFFQGVTAGIAAEGNPGEVTTIAGLSGYVTATEDGILVVFLDGNLIVMVVGPEQAPLTALAAALISGNA